MKTIISVLFWFLLGEVLTRSDKIKLKDVQVLTLRRGKYTKARRSDPVPQLTCIGGTAGCSFIPETVQCYNQGTDGVTINWKCKGEMDKKYSFGDLVVSCEGYDSPDDPFIFAGSCGLEFTLNRASSGVPPHDPKIGSGYAFLIMIVFGALIWLMCVAKGQQGMGYYGQQQQPGFGSGFLTGSTLGYVLGRNQGGGGSSGYSRVPSAPPPQDEKETKTGYATSKQR